MSQVLNRVRDVDPNDNEAVKDALSSFFQNLSKHTELDSNRWLRVLENILNRFPRYCAPHRSLIETYLSHFLDSHNYFNVIMAAKSGHSLQQIKPSNEKSATAKACWREQTSVLCQAAHSLIDVIFTNTANIYKNNNKPKEKEHQLLGKSPLTMALASISTVAVDNSNILNKRALLCTRLKNVLIFLQAMLVETFPVAKPVQPQLILGLIMQALSASSSSGISSSADVSTVKIQALKTLDALVACLGANLIPFSALVFRFVMQTLRWSSENTNEESRKVRCAAYASLGGWLRALRSHRAAAERRARAWDDELAAHIVRDITPHQHVVQLTMSKQPTKNLSKKAKRKLANSMLQESSIASHMPGENNKVSSSEQTTEEVALSALECAETFITVCGIFLKPSIHKQFHERLVRECYQLENHSRARAARLLRALEAARKAAPAAAPPPAQYCLDLYSRLLRTSHTEIANFCSQALLDIKLHLHCSPPSLNFAIDVQQQQKDKEDSRKKTISEKNRAALESLLGPERFKDTEVINEIIDIPDEPSSKKPRIEPDNISLSSESVTSVVISDDSEVEESVIQDVQVFIEDHKGTHIEENKNSESVATHSTNITNSQENNYNSTQGVTINSLETQNVTQLLSDNNDETDNLNIFEAKTQIALISSNDTIEGDKSPVSMEVGYDYPNTGKEKVKVLDKIDDENLPSTNDTDDVQITCGQEVKISQDVETVVNSKADKDKNENEGGGNAETHISEVTKVNGAGEVETVTMQNGDGTVDSSNLVTKVTVDDMLADFVDEVN